jgi:O-acetyl-ADP-ribose deacetylase (regulator of RNase III)
MTDKIELIKSDITTIDVDAIVNAANSKLAGGGGVDGAIHRAAGPQLHQACMALNGCETGHSKITSGFNLPAKYIIHTVGPVWHGGRSNEENLLRSCYITSLQLTTEHNIRTIAFPNISTGIYGYPKPAAAEIAINSVMEFLGKNNTIEKVIFVCFDDENYELYRIKLNQ